eukprot:CAMPEP_0194189560 /NCGR_PEP_ID=MMETSP0154-20130528/59556_1 /TAXON_ID=1049557 /ORGANISM="Thalassiothrix antarctica, Strain L6-D1" /LENGTH=211 /DNA_ID=CAMNT_0038910799 /DNA_START=250 /DNA_END=882 /DNA_ORIENTATION=+
MHSNIRVLSDLGVMTRDNLYGGTSENKNQGELLLQALNFRRQMDSVTYQRANITSSLISRSIELQELQKQRQLIETNETNLNAISTALLSFHKIREQQVVQQGVTNHQSAYEKLLTANNQSVMAPSSMMSQNLSQRSITSGKYPDWSNELSQSKLNGSNISILGNSIDYNKQNPLGLVTAQALEGTLAMSSLNKSAICKSEDSYYPSYSTV